VDEGTAEAMTSETTIASATPYSVTTHKGAVTHRIWIGSRSDPSSVSVVAQEPVMRDLMQQLRATADRWLAEHPEADA
jgi:hypothetical protein